MTVAIASTATGRRHDAVVFGLALFVTAVVGALAAVGGVVIVAAVSAIALFVAVAARPALGAYVYAATLPFVAGIERDVLLPVLRPSEALHGLLMVAVLTHWAIRFARGELTRVHVTRLDWALLVMAVLSSVWPLVSGLLREVELLRGDLIATLEVWRYFALYALYRVVLRTAQDVRRCLWILLLGAGGLSVIALSQSLGVSGIEALLSPWYAVPDVPGSGRGTATLGNSIAVGDYLAYALALLIVWYERVPGARRALLPLGFILVAGIFGTGQFSAWIAACIVVVTIAGHERRFGTLLRRSAPLLAVGIVGGWPVVAKRLVELSSGGLPVSWIVRWDNLSTFYLPHLNGWNLLFGVRPETMILAPETWREEIFLESGHLAFLWVGGLPLLIAFFFLLWVTLQHTRRIALTRTDDVGAAALAAWSSLWALAVLTTLDIHLTLRGGADVLFILLGISANQLVRPPPRTERVQR